MGFARTNAKALLRLLIGVAALLPFLANAQHSEIMRQIQGDWTSYRIRVPSGFAKVDLKFAGATFTQEYQMIMFMPVVPGEGSDTRLSSEIVSSVADTDDVGRSYHRLFATLTGFEMRFHSVREVEARNRSSYCGFSDWQPGVYKNIAGLSCVYDEDEPPLVQPAAGDRIMFLVHLAEDGVTMHASLGLDDDGSVEDLNIDWNNGLYRPEGDR